MQHSILIEFFFVIRSHHNLLGRMEALVVRGGASLLRSKLSRRRVARVVVAGDGVQWFRAGECAEFTVTAYNDLDDLALDLRSQDLRIDFQVLADFTATWHGPGVLLVQYRRMPKSFTHG